MKKLLLATALATLPLATQAEEAPIIARYWTNSGSLPPAYAWETAVTIYEDGQLILRHCRGYETEGPACKDDATVIPLTEVEQILTAARASGLGETPARAPDAVLVGGPLTGGEVFLEGVKLDLPASTAPQDEARVASVLRAIEAAVPAEMAHFLIGE